MREVRDLEADRLPDPARSEGAVVKLAADIAAGSKNRQTIAKTALVDYLNAAIREARASKAALDSLPPTSPTSVAVFALKQVAIDFDLRGIDR